MKHRSELSLSMDHRVKPGGDENGNTDTLSNPVEHGHMITCWQNGRRVMMHSSEVAKLMKGSSSSLPGRTGPPATVSSRAIHEEIESVAIRCETRQSMKRQSEPQRCMDGRVPMSDLSDIGKLNCPSRLEPAWLPGHDELDKHDAKLFDLTPPPIVPRGRTLVHSEGWQMLAKKLVEKAGHPPRCHKSACRRGKRCAGGGDACYVREFEAVDIAMQRFLRRHGAALRAQAQAAMASA